MSCKAYRYDPNMPAAERDARRHVRRLRGFYLHATVFVLVNFGLAAINLVTTPDRAWHFWPLAGWGIALAIHGLTVLSRGQWLGAEWEERKLRQLLGDGR